MRYTKLPCSGAGGDFLTLPCQIQDRKDVRFFTWRSAEADALCFSYRYALGLALTNECPFGFGHIAENLQDKVGYESAGQIPLLMPSIEQGHIDHNHIHTGVFGYKPPLLDDFLVITAQAINTLNK